MVDFSASASECSQDLANLAVNAMHASHTIQLDVIFSFLVSSWVMEGKGDGSPVWGLI